MPTVGWKPADIIKLMAVATLCACIMSVVITLLVAVMIGRIQPDQLGTISKAGAAVGLIGLVYVLVSPLKRLIK